MYKKNELLIIGRKPILIGGVTIHVSRLISLLDKVNVLYDFYDLNIFNVYSFINVIKITKYAHLHSSSPLFRFFFVLICKIFNTKSIITYHGDLGRFSSFYNLIDYLSVRLVDIPIVINKKSYFRAIMYNNETICMSAYIPNMYVETLDVSILNKINELKKCVNFLVCTNASSYALDKYGKEIYGVKILVDLFRKHPDWGLIISDPSGGYSKLLCNLEKNILVISKPHSFIPVLEKSDCFVRYTSTDGDSLSIHEALNCGVHVVATNVVDRPENVYQVLHGDIDQLTSLFQHLELEGVKPKCEIDDLLEIDILKFYKKLFLDNNTNNLIS
ncbi:glycosyltransferase family 1 protein [Parabacteroides faecis]|uniref:glycosyltransferase family 1 protein n=1 Tax=Parabacteroides TaxID=375288 RepID=UPI000F001535|nr:MULTISPECIES: glycosyltransferase family 1 protein [Parabacteroides]MBC8619271.1 glycosyltransferase family 1 protein [Parabacteroides faecis]RHR91232.1 glycosyltransferase family 1 protein [Parabacteroides sp. AF14-59]